MATYATDLSTFDLCDADTNWSELSGHTSGGAAAEDTENYIHNSCAISQPTGQATGTNAGLECDYGSTLSWTSGWVFMVWQAYTAPTNLNSWSSGGMRIGIGSSSGNINFWNALGNDFGNYPYGGWQNTAIDPEVSADSYDGSPSAGSYRIFGSLPNVQSAVSKGNPHAVDAIRFGRGELQVTGTGATFDGMASANDADTARWGLFQATGGGYLWKGLMSLGLTGTSVTFSDSNESIRIEDTPRVAAGFNKIEINNSSSSVTLTSISISGVQTSITGSAPISPGDFEVVDNATVSIDSCTFTDMGTFDFLSNTDVTDCVFRRCGEVTQGGADITGCLFTNSESAVSLVVDDLDLVSGNTFISDGSNHAVNLGTISASDTVTWDNTTSGYETSDGSTGNETILVNVATSQTLTINVAAGATTPSVYNTGSGSVSVVSGQVTLTITVKDGSVSPPATITDESVRVYVEAASGGPLSEGTEIIKSLTNTSGQVSDTRSLASDQPIQGWARRATAGYGALPSGYTFFKETKISGTFDNAANTSITILLQPDE